MTYGFDLAKMIWMVGGGIAASIVFLVWHRKKLNLDIEKLELEKEKLNLELDILRKERSAIYFPTHEEIKEILENTKNIRLGPPSLLADESLSLDEYLNRLNHFLIELKPYFEDLSSYRSDIERREAGSLVHVISDRRSDFGFPDAAPIFEDWKKLREQAQNELDKKTFIRINRVLEFLDRLRPSRETERMIENNRNL